MRRGMTAFSILALVLGVAGLVTAADSHRAEGTIVLMTPAMIQMKVDGTIRSFDRTPESQIDAGVNQGDRAVIWYETAGESMRVSRMSVSQSSSSTAPEAMTSESGADSENGADSKRPSRSQMDQTDSSQSSQQMDRSDVGTERDLSYEEYQRQSRERMSERTELPQTATHTREIGLAGMMLLVLGAGLWVRSARS